MTTASSLGRDSLYCDEDERIQLPISRPAVSQHLRVLEDGGVGPACLVSRVDSIRSSFAAKTGWCECGEEGGL
jgi:DNA-binding transcriptional ArsR family regulator